MSLSNSLISGVFCVGIRFRVWVLDQYREVLLYRTAGWYQMRAITSRYINSLILAPLLRLALFLGFLPLALRGLNLTRRRGGSRMCVDKKTSEINELDRDTKILKI